MQPSKRNPSAISSSLRAAALQEHIINAGSKHNISTRRKKQYVDFNIAQIQKLKVKTTISHKVSQLSDKRLDVIPAQTLAQKIGIVSKPDPQISFHDWAQIKLQCLQRCNNNCPICQEEFKMEAQILLSCSHLFHRECIESYERYTSAKTCPICRRKEYQKLLTYEGMKLHQHKSAVNIQSAWRAFVCRRNYKLHQSTNAPSHPILRQKFAISKLSEESKRLEDKIVRSTREMENLFVSLDLERAARGVINDRAQFSTGEFDTNFDNVKTAVKTHAAPKIDWHLIFSKANERAVDNCPICLQSITLPDKLYSESRSNRKLVVLSCSHFYHQKCLDSFEKFGNLSCPLCRDRDYVSLKLN